MTPDPKLWENLGGSIAYRNFAVVSRTAGSLDVIVVRKLQPMDPLGQRLFWNAWLSGWQGWIDVGKPAPLHAGYSPAAVARGPDRLDAFVVSLAVEPQLYRNQWHGQWLGWTSLGAPVGGVHGRPSACRSYAEGATVALRGDGGAVYVKSYRGDKVGTAWQSIGGDGGENAPVLVSTWGAGTLEVLAMTVKGELVHKSFTPNGGWKPSQTGWWPVGAALLSPYSLAVARSAPDRLDLFFGGDDGRGPGIYHKWKSPKSSKWTGGTRLEGQASDLQAVSGAANSIDIVGRLSDYGVHHRNWNGTQWHPPPAVAWAAIGGEFHDDCEPGIAAWGPGRLDVFVVAEKIQNIGGDDNVWHRWRDGKSWSTFR